MAKALKELKYLHNRIFKPGVKYVERSCVRYINVDDANDHVNEVLESENKITVGRTAAQIISGAIEDVTLTFTCATEGAAIYINEAIREGNKITVDKGTTVSWAASKPGFKTATGTVVADSTKTVELPALVPMYTLTFTCATEGATIKIDGSVRTDNKITVEAGTEVSWEASKEGYKTLTGTEVADSTKPVNIPALTKLCTLSFPTIPEDAIVEITYDGKTYEQRSAIVEAGTEVSVKASKEGCAHSPKTRGPKVVTENWAEVIDLTTEDPAA